MRPRGRRVAHLEGIVSVDDDGPDDGPDDDAPAGDAGATSTEPGGEPRKRRRRRRRRGGDRPPGAEGGAPGGGDRSVSGDRSAGGDRSGGDRSSGDRSGGDRSGGDRGGDRGGGGDRPRRDWNARNLDGGSSGAPRPEGSTQPPRSDGSTQPPRPTRSTTPPMGDALDDGWGDDDSSASSSTSPATSRGPAGATADSSSAPPVEGRDDRSGDAQLRDRPEGSHVPRSGEGIGSEDERARSAAQGSGDGDRARGTGGGADGAGRREGEPRRERRRRGERGRDGGARDDRGRAGGERPQGDRSQGDRSQGDRSQGDRAQADRPLSDRGPLAASDGDTSQEARANEQRGDQQRGDRNRNRDGGRGERNRGARDDNRGRDARNDARGGGGQGGAPDARGEGGAPDARGDGRARDARGDGGRGARDGGGRDQRADGPAREKQQFAPPAAPSLQGRRAQASDEDVETPQEGREAWGTDDDSPVKDVVFTSDFATDAPSDDVDPVTWALPASEKLGEVGGIVGVRFTPGGRIVWADAGDQVFAIGTRLVVDTERGQRLATVATAPSRKMTRERVRRVIRIANEGDLAGEREGDADTQKALRIAKDAASKYRLPMKVYRVELHGQLGRGAKMNLYYTSDDRLDLRGFIADVSRDTGARVELRQLGVRDEAKAVGGIGSCGLTLCCTTWLPDFVPVSIKMAKDQGLVLSPTKVSGQCGRLKCCLVYEQAGYAELRKGLPKLGKRVVSQRGEGRVVEVDVLRQRVRVSYGMGDSEVLPAGDVKPLFPPGSGPGDRGERGERDERGERERGPRRDDRGGRRDERRGDRRDEPVAPAEVEERDEDPATLVGELYADLDQDDDDAGPTDDPSSMHHVGDDEDAPTDDPSSLDHVAGGHTGLEADNDTDDSDD